MCAGIAAAVISALTQPDPEQTMNKQAFAALGLIGGLIVGGSVVALLNRNSDSAASTNSAAKSISYSSVVDLAQPIDANIPIWPGDPTPTFVEMATIEKDGFYLRSFTIGEHSATHMNSGNSFFEGGTSIDSYTPESLVRTAVVIDVREQAAKDADYQISVDDITAWETKHGKVPEGSVVMAFTGWQDKWSDPQAFLNLDADGSLHFPGFATKTTEWMLAERKIGGVGIDTHGVDPGLDTAYGTNTAVLKAKGVVLECLTNLDKLAPTGNTVVLGPLRLKDGSDTPLSVMAFIPSA
jgi:kynurenine formamidase